MNKQTNKQKNKLFGAKKGYARNVYVYNLRKLK